MSAATCKRCACALPEGRRAYCGDKCKRLWRLADRVKREPAKCDHCGADFMALSSWRRRGKARYCSSRCVALSAIVTGRFAGSNNPRWLGGVSNDNMRYRTRQKQRWPQRDRARRMVRDALLSGRLVRQPCEVCGDQDTHGHHDDYDQPLAVRWLCRVHHDEHHARHGRGLMVPGAA